MQKYDQKADEALYRQKMLDAAVHDWLTPELHSPKTAMQKFPVAQGGKPGHIPLAQIRTCPWSFMGFR
jgi:hypothetical protein